MYVIELNYIIRKFIRCKKSITSHKMQEKYHFGSICHCHFNNYFSCFSEG
jgi:hypothetical protein